MPRSTAVWTAALVGVLVAECSAQSGLRLNRRRNEQSPPPFPVITRPAATDASEVQLPRDRRLWHNSPPLAMESLAGKGVVFYFFEEESPAVANGWPGLQSAVASQRDQPVLLMAVNSGTDPRDLKRYLGRYRVSVPVIHDPNREFESLMGVAPLSPNGQSYAVRYITAEGQIGSGQGTGPAALKSAFEQAAQGAAWRVDPKSVPNSLRGAWRAIELGDFASVAKPLTRAAAKEGPTKEAAETLLAAVEEEADATFKTALESEGDRRRWLAYQALSSMEERFRGYDFESLTKAEEIVGKLAKIKEVKDEIAAAKLLATAISKRSASNLRRVESKYPGTEAAERATAMLASQ